MQSPALPPNEAERLADLYDYGILDAPASKVFDEIAELAATICGTSFAAITLIDRERQWFKAQHGLGIGSTSRDESICGHAILERDVFVVPDTSRDPRFAGNPALQAPAAIRFYGGSQLRSDRGNAIGMLCVMDSQPQDLAPAQRKALAQLADVLMAVLEAGRRTRLLSWFGKLVDHMQDEVLILDPDSLRYLFANRAAQEHLGHTLDEMRTLTPMDVTGDFDRPKFERFVQRLREGEPYVTFDGVRCHADAQTYPVEARWQLLKTGGRTVVLSIVHDVTERRGSERMKDEFITRLSRELDMARSMQRGLLPPPGRVHGLQLAWFFEASSFVGGDIFDYVVIDGSRLGFFMVDVAGHGVAAAMMALSAQHQLYAMARRHGSALLAQGRSIAETAVALIEEYNERTMQLRDRDLFVTLLFGIYDCDLRRAAIVQAGHPPALVAAPGAREFTPVGDGGVPVGILERPGYEAHCVDLPPGSRLALYSDGVVECVNARTAAYGEQRFAQLLAATRGDPVADVARALGDALSDWRSGEAFEDDVSFFLLEAV